MCNLFANTENVSSLKTPNTYAGTAKAEDEKNTMTKHRYCRLETSLDAVISTFPIFSRSRVRCQDHPIVPYA
ncbi:hypothetical protein PC118_g13777 [Phytophthora cactorum]|uniref:Uncharacterized protein n=1 Tax=Phytophthora cactorum TaxID=29920 RepID=A0A8T1FHH0_9STRA|nr:hypothetical protein PC118_g13777 [Phytophthora cactorum]KAG3007024.1 hypothetical protein PC119_g14760 [Phytophthora cactorum]